MKKKETDIKKYNEFEKSRPQQLDLFSTLGGIFERDKEKYSATAELYDIVPKYVLMDVEKLRTKEGFLPILNRDFVFKKQTMSMKITPALLEVENGKSKAFYPSTREEIIEDVLRKFATDSNRNEFLDDRLSVKFSLYDLWKELRKIKHPYDYNQIKESLNILSKTNIEIVSENTKLTFSSNMFETFGIADYNDNTQIEYDENYSKKVIYFVRFNSLVSESVKNKTWRVINYEQCMSYKKNISRWLHKRISNMFLNARLEIPYNILLSTIIRDSGMTEYKQLRDSKRQIISCLEEMIKVGSIDRYEVETIFDEHKTTKILDVKFLLYISESFFADIQKSFLKDKDLSQILLYKQEERRLREQAKKSKRNSTTDEMDVNNVENGVDNTIIDSETDTKIQTEIIKLLTSLNISQKDINKILSSKKNQKNLEQVKNNIITAKNYIEKKQKNNEEEECNNIAIILASIKDNWNDNKTDEETTTNNKKTKHNTKTEEETEEDKKQKNIKTAKDYIKTEIKDKVFKKISNNLLKYFGPNIYLAWISNLKFVEIKDDTLILSCTNGFIIDTIKKDYLNGVYRKEPDNTITWLRKGIKEIVEETEPEIKKIDIMKVDK